ncbi:MAG: caspase family protein [Alphaproteobacteria bacterium]
MRNLVLSTALAVTIGAVATSAWAEIDERRVALVIGNQAYQYAGELSQTRHDADEMAAALQAVGFDVMLVHDADRRQMQQSLNQFRRELRDADVALVYYSGHGMEVDGENYLAPVSARLGDRRTLDAEFVALSEIMDTVETGGAAFNMVILDACRNNPFADQMEATRSTVSASPGLAPVQAPLGTVVAYATAPGTYAWEGGQDYDNSLFTEALVQNMTREGLELAHVFRETRRLVVEMSAGEQVPWEHSAMIGEFYFVPAGGLQVAANQGSIIDAGEQSSPFAQSSIFGRSSDNPPVDDTPATPTPTPTAGVLSSVTPESMQALLQNVGISSVIEEDEDGPVLVVDNTGSIPGAGVGVWFFDCQGSECGSFQIWTYFESQRPVDLRVINRWNSEQRWSIAAVEDERFPVLTLDINVDGGVSQENIADLVQLFAEQARQFQGYVL